MHLSVCANVQSERVKKRIIKAKQNQWKVLNHNNNETIDVFIFVSFFHLSAAAAVHSYRFLLNFFHPINQSAARYTRKLCISVIKSNNKYISVLHHFVELLLFAKRCVEMGASEQSRTVWCTWTSFKYAKLFFFDLLVLFRRVSHHAVASAWTIDLLHFAPYTSPGIGMACTESNIFLTFSLVQNHHRILTDWRNRKITTDK